MSDQSFEFRRGGEGVRMWELVPADVMKAPWRLQHLFGERCWRVCNLHNGGRLWIGKAWGGERYALFSNFSGTLIETADGYLSALAKAVERLGITTVVEGAHDGRR